MEYKSDLLDGWVGTAVLVQGMTGPEVDDEGYGRLVSERGSGLYGDARSFMAVVTLVGYDGIGIAVRNKDGADTYFVPWGAVLSLYQLELVWDLADE